MTWIPVGERLPEVGAKVLGWDAEEGEAVVFELCRELGMLSWDGNDRRLDFDVVTHWQPLPEPPEPERP